MKMYRVRLAKNLYYQPFLQEVICYILGDSAAGTVNKRNFIIFSSRSYCIDDKYCSFVEGTVS